VLIPLMGAEGFAWWAQDLHDYLGPFFTIGVALMIVSWIRDNIPRPWTGIGSSGAVVSSTTDILLPGA
jgi:hypothetical protein